MSSAQIRLTEPQVFLVGSLENERARARQRRAHAREAAHANRTPTGETPPPSPGPSSRRTSPEREGRGAFHISASRAGSRSRPGSRAASPAATPRGRVGSHLAGTHNNPDEGFVPPNSRGRSASRTRAPSAQRQGAHSESLSVGRSGSVVRDAEQHLSTATPEPPVVSSNSALDEPPPALLRGLLTVTLSKPTRVKEIQVRLKGTAKTDWPEGIGPRRLDVVEENILINVTHTFFSASNSSTTRRAASVDPSSRNGRDESRGRTPARRAASVAPGRDSSHGRSFPHNSLFPNGLENPPPTSRRGSETAHSSHLLSRISSNDSGATSTPASLPPGVRPGEAAPAYEAVPSAPTSPHASYPSSPFHSRPSSPLASAPSSPLHLPATISEEVPSLDELDLSASRPAYPRRGSATPLHLQGATTPSRSPLGMSAALLPTADAQDTNDNSNDRSRMPRLARSSTRASQDSEHSTSSSHTSHSHEAHETHPGARSTSSLVSHSSTSDHDRGRSTNRATAASDTPPTDLTIETNGISRNSRSSLNLSSNMSPSPSGATSPTSSHAPRLPSAMKGAKSSSRSGSRARFSLGGISEVLRGKSSSRVRTPNHEELHVPPPPTITRRDSSPDVTRSSGRSQSRGRKTALKVLREALTTGHAHLHDQESGEKADHGHGHADEHSSGDGWKEFKAGTYVYPISIPISGTLPPTLNCEFGSVAYNLKATVVRAGALTPNLTAHTEVQLVAMPGEDDTEESESIVVERFWETQMKYHVALSGKSFPIGGQIPLTIRLSPLAKVKVFRISAQLEQKTSYFASVNSGRKLTRHESPRKVMLVRVDHKDPDEPMLPILSDSQNVLLDHPLRDWFINATSSDDSTPSLLDPDGPWHLEHHLQLPDCSSKINFSTGHEKANIAISHILKVMIRVERGDDEYLDPKGKRKRWDIVVETPVHLLSCRCAQNLLPAYSASSATLSTGHATSSSSGSSSIISRALRTATGSSTPHDHTCGTGINGAAPGSSSSLTTSGTTSGSNSMGSRASGIGASVMHPRGSNSSHQHSHHGILGVGGGGAHSHHQAPVASLEQNLLFARLISGETTPNGETPPTYAEVSQSEMTQGESRGRSSGVVVVDD
ncbi:uncharacterized protein JCM15063_004897 [Sporobolomyces koalae]|uniref:uncharacterized protein n=1 Tax=Sporobolomyces koalae TaxID=500713 RepID=UPI00316F8C53